MSSFIFNCASLPNRFVIFNSFIFFSKIDMGTKRALEVKRVAALYIKAGNSMTPTAKTS